MLDKAFEDLKSYDWGTDKSVLNPIEDAVVATHGKADERKALEGKLLAALGSEISRDAKDYVCRKLMVVGTAAAVPTLAGLLANKDLAHMARFALERIQGSEASKALIEALPKLAGNLKIGVISSLGSRREAEAAPALGQSLVDSDAAVARSAAIALGHIASAEAAKTLQSAAPMAAEARQAVTDAQLACAEALLAENKKADALAIYKSLVGEGQAKHVRLAATRGMLACAGKKE